MTMSPATSSLFRLERLGPSVSQDRARHSQVAARRAAVGDMTTDSGEMLLGAIAALEADCEVLRRQARGRQRARTHHGPAYLILPQYPPYGGRRSSAALSGPLPGDILRLQMINTAMAKLSRCYR